jgi:two-component system cell cycle sensor histidine kinase/response regulator CckA
MTPMTSNRQDVTSEPNGPIVLIVDDEESVRRLAARALKMAGYRVLEAGGGNAALTFLESNTPLDLLLTDINMPDLKGDEVARRFRRARPDLKVLYLSGFVDSLFADRSVLWEDEAFLEKPFSIKSLLEAVSLATSGHPIAMSA